MLMLYDGMRTIAFCCRHDFWVMHRGGRRERNPLNDAHLTTGKNKTRESVEFRSAEGQIDSNQMDLAYIRLKTSFLATLSNENRERVMRDFALQREISHNKKNQVPLCRRPNR